MDTLSLTTLDTIGLIGPIYMGYVAVFLIGLGIGLFLGSIYVSVNRE